MFGDVVARIIDGLTKIEEIFDLSETTPQAENFRKMLLTLSDDVRVILIKLADRLHNMRTLDAMPRHKQLKIASETLYLFAPLAHRLGLYSIKSELEDLSLKYTEPEIYQSIFDQLKLSRSARTRFYNKFIYPIKKELGAKNIKYEILAREKNIYAIWEKMRTKGIPFEEVYDLFAVRIIIDVPQEMEKAECWRVYSIITDYYRPNQDRLRDWISIPKANGYEALHTTVMSQSGRWVEVQIRSKRMNEIAEKGYAAHWKYKDMSDSESGLEEWLFHIREIIQNNDGTALDFLSDFELNLYSDEIFVFTPKGDLITLPKGSSALDFAYNIHSDIGNTTIGAKVNHELKPLSYHLKSGDQVEIITSAIQQPQEEWMNYVSTSRAKSKIKLAIKEQGKQLTDQGREMLSKYFEESDVPLDHKNLEKLLDYHKIGSEKDLYQMIGNNSLTREQVEEFLNSLQNRNLLRYISRPFSRTREMETKSLSDTIVEKLKSKPESLVLSDDMAEMNYSIAKCCQPIPGDDVIGFLSPEDKILIHRTNCNEAIRMMSRYGNRIVKAKWRYKESVGFLSGIKISGIDKQGLIRKITEIISDKHNISIRSFHMDTSEGTTEGTIMVYVQDTITLNKLINNLKKIKELVSVKRLDRIS
jgi:GTP pyrophosphokinase